MSPPAVPRRRRPPARRSARRAPVARGRAPSSSVPMPRHRFRPCSPARRRPRLWSRGHAQGVEQRGEHAFGGEVLLGQLPRRPTVALVRPDDLLRSRRRLIEGGERHQPFSARQQVADSGVLREHRTAARQVARAAIAQPAAAGVDREVLGDHQLGGRAVNVVAVAPRVAGGRVGISEQPAVLLESPDVGAVGVVDVERDLERGRRPRGQLEEAAELVDAQAVRPAFVLDRAERPAPAGDAREPPAAPRRRPPLRELDRGLDRDPVDSARGDRAVGLADAPADRYVAVVAVEEPGEPEVVPDLHQARVDVEEDPQLGRAEDLLVVEVPHHVEQQRGAAGELDELGARPAGLLAPAVVEQRPAIAEPEPLHHLGEVAQVRRRAEGRGIAAGVDAHSRLQPIDEAHVPAKALEAEQVLEEDPSVSAVPRPLGQCAGDDDRLAHRRGDDRSGSPAQLRSVQSRLKGCSMGTDSSHWTYGLIVVALSVLALNVLAIATARERVSDDDAGAAGPPSLANLGSATSDAPARHRAGWRLVWHDEFNRARCPNERKWGFERGFIRNEELQWYQRDNALCDDGTLVIEAIPEAKPNPNYRPDSDDWRENRASAGYTSASLTSNSSFTYGRFEMLARIDTRQGSWPTFWTLGTAYRREPTAWPQSGEVDIMEYYRNTVLANVCKPKRSECGWDSARQSLAGLGGDAWAHGFHLWAMEWSARKIDLYLDNELV